MIAEEVDVMFITSTSFLIQSKDGRVVILCYRGTPPTSLITWVTDIEVDPVKLNIPFFNGSPEDYVHGGFYRNVRSTGYEIVGALARAMDGRSVLQDGGQMPNALEALYITGHSLGGASAAMLAIMLLTEPRYKPIVSKLKAVYTFGQPMITSPQLAEKCNDNDFLRERVIRYVYENDIAPQLPPKESGGFRHFGTEYQYKPQGGSGAWNLNKEPRKQLSNVLTLVTNPLSFLARQFKLTRDVPFHASVNDHLPQYYIAALTPRGVRSEFGD
jgi:Lipase (class 3)